VKDPSGVADVKIVYNYILFDGSTKGESSSSMSLISGDKYDGGYEFQIDVGKEAVQYLDPNNGHIEYQIYATDTVGNSPKDVPVNNIEVLACP